MRYVVRMSCSHVSGCPSDIYAKDLCRKHYWQQWRAARAEDPDTPGCKECGDPVLANDLCGKHYQQEYRRTRKKSRCKILDCPGDAQTRGWCYNHHYRWKKYGDPLGRPSLVKDNLCSMGDGEQAQTRWIEDGELKGYLCGPHDRRWRAYGDPAEPPRRAANGQARHLRKDDGYIDVSVPGPNGKLRTRREHIVFMEELLGRPLAGDENVHHCNGVKHDNTTNGPLVAYRSGNLELWSTKQPKGQRVEDKIEFAIEILREYAPGRLHPTMVD